MKNTTDYNDGMAMTALMVLVMAVLIVVHIVSDV